MISSELLPRHPDTMGMKQQGFTLIELAVVLFLVTLVLGGVMMPLATRVEQEGREKTEAQLQEIKETLIGYAIVNGHLPCPDCPDDTAAVNCGAGAAVSNDGIEDGTDNPPTTGLSPRNTVTDDFEFCAVQVGNLPWATLGVDQFDAWGRPFVYSVTGTFADNTAGTTCGTATAGVSFELCSLGDMTIRDAAATNVVASNVPVVVYSYGANGEDFGGATPPTSADELENWWTDAIDGNYIYADYNQTAANEFDDLFIWISPATLMYKMVHAERLP